METKVLIYVDKSDGGVSVDRICDLSQTDTVINSEVAYLIETDMEKFGEDWESDFDVDRNEHIWHIEYADEDGVGERGDEIIGYYTII
jgi:hypothetical protein